MASRQKQASQSPWASFNPAEIKSLDQGSSSNLIKIANAHSQILA